MMENESHNISLGMLWLSFSKTIVNMNLTINLNFIELLLTVRKGSIIKNTNKINRESTMSKSIEKTQKSERSKKQHYGSFTATAMIVGIVIGSGIFFKCDDVLNDTGGNIGLGILVFSIGALSIIFGSLTLTELSMRCNNSGGFVGYYEKFISKEAASAFGWFQTLVYYPTINSVVAWVAGIYTCSLLGIRSTLETQIAISFLYLTIIFALNIISLKIGGYFQNLATAIKLVPLLGIALVGLFWSAPIPEIPAGVEMISRSDVGFKWIAALAPIAFSYDGWAIATSITNEVKNPRKNMTLALIVGPLIILAVYLLYFVGFTRILGAEYILSLGDDALNIVGTLLLGNYGKKILLTIIIIAVLGVVNGITLGSLRMPQALASKNMFPFSAKVAKINPEIELSISSSMVSYGVTVFWLGVHYLTKKSGLMRNGDVSEIAIVFSYVCYSVLYLKVIKMKKDQEISSVFKGIICPVLALMGSLIILIGGLASNPKYVLSFIGINSFVCLLGFIYFQRKKER